MSSQAKVVPSQVLEEASSAPSGKFWPLLLLSAAIFASNYGRAMLGPVQETMQRALSLSDNQIAILQGSALAVAFGCAAVPFGMLADRASRVKLLVTLSLLNMVGNLLAAGAMTFAILFAGRCLVGLAIAGTMPAVFSLVADLYPPSQRGRATMVTGVGSAAGTSAAFALGGALLATHAGQGGWREALLSLTAPLAVVTVLLLALREPTRLQPESQSSLSRGTLAELWRFRAVIAPLVFGFVMIGIGDMAALVWAAPMLSRTFSLPSDRIGTIMAAVLLISGILGPVGGGVLADLCQRAGGPRRTMGVLGSLALLSAPSGLFAVAPSVASASALLVVFMTIGNAIGTMTTTLCIVVVPRELRGVCIAILSATGGMVGITLAPLAVSLLSGWLGGATMIGRALAFVAVVAALLGTVTFAAGRRGIPRAEGRGVERA